MPTISVQLALTSLLADRAVRRGGRKVRREAAKQVESLTSKAPSKRSWRWTPDSGGGAGLA
jgi:hypothetical protein